MSLGERLSEDWSAGGSRLGDDERPQLTDRVGHGVSRDGAPRERPAQLHAELQDVGAAGQLQHVHGSGVFGGRDDGHSGRDIADGEGDVGVRVVVARRRDGMVYYQFVWKLYLKDRLNGKKHKGKYAEIFYKVN